MCNGYFASNPIVLVLNTIAIMLNIRLCSRSNISNTRDSVSLGYPNTAKGVENTTRSGVFLTKFEVFEKPIKHCLECLIYLFNRNKN